jgi:hypothetical protein
LDEAQVGINYFLIECLKQIQKRLAYGEQAILTFVCGQSQIFAIFATAIYSPHPLTLETMPFWTYIEVLSF